MISVAVFVNVQIAICLVVVDVVVCHFPVAEIVNFCSVAECCQTWIN